MNIPTPPLGDPHRTERIGAALARQLADQGITVIVCWDANEDVVLAHVVARELAVPLRLATAVEGIVALHHPLPEGAVTGLVANELAPGNSVGGLAGVVHHAGARIAAVATATEPAVVTGTYAETATVVTPEQP